MFPYYARNVNPPTNTWPTIGLWRFDTRSMYYFYTRAYENSWLTRLARMREVRGLERFDASLLAIGRFERNLNNAFMQKLSKITTWNFVSW